MLRPARPSRRLTRRLTLLGTAAGLAVATTLAGAAGASAAPSPAGTTTAAPRPVATPTRATTDATARYVAARTGLSQAAALARVRAQGRLSLVADRLAAQLGRTYGGAYFDRSGRLVVNVTAPTATAAVTRAGGTARLVHYSRSQLDAISTALRRQHAPVGTYWGIDASADQLVLTIPTTAPAGSTSALLATARRYGAAVRVTRTTETVSTLVSYLAGGYPIYNSPSGARCSAGFNTYSGSSYYLLDAGHCAALGGYWSNFNGDPIGPSVAAAFPGADTGVIAIDSGQIIPVAGVYLYDGTYQTIDFAADAYPGLYACKTGSTSGVTCGTVWATNTCVTYAEGTVCGLDETDIYAAPGDSGGSYFTGDYGLGTVSGGNSSVTFFQPLVPALNYWGLSLI
jgi:streptogrisin D